MLKDLLMRLLPFIIIIGGCLLIATTAAAHPLEGFLEGPYLAFQGGAVQVDFDTDQQSGTNVGRAIEPTAGFLFGWNIWDHLAAELKGEYMTNDNHHRREHMINALMGLKYTFILDPLVDFPTLRILPFVETNLAARFSILPGNVLSSDQKITSSAVGPSAGGGIAFLWKKYFFFGIGAREDFLFYEGIHQNLDLATPPTTNQSIYSGGFKPSFAVMSFVGVHY